MVSAPAAGRPRLIDRIPGDDATEVFEAFEGWAREQGFTLYPAQEEALIELVSGANVILATPTGSGKSLVALGAHFAALARDDVTFYRPIKALVSEKFFARWAFKPENVGMLTATPGSTRTHRSSVVAAEIWLTSPWEATAPTSARW